MAVSNTSLVGITGATGFIGKHLVRTLKGDGYGTRALVRDNVSDAEENIKGDLIEKKALSSFLNGVDVVVNLVGGYYPPFEDQLRSNVLAINNLCEEAVGAKVKKIVHISTAAVYGVSESGQKLKEEDVTKPDTRYGLAKRLAEKVCEFYGHNTEIPFIILRPANVYGPGSDHGTVASLVEAAKKTGQVTIYGDGKARRDFLFVSDMVGAIIKAIEFDSKYEVFNIGTGEDYSLLDLVRFIEKITGKELEKNFKKKQDYVSEMVAPNVEKATKKLEWKAEVSLEEGLKKLLKSP